MLCPVVEVRFVVGKVWHWARSPAGSGRPHALEIVFPNAALYRIRFVFLFILVVFFYFKSRDDMTLPGFNNDDTLKSIAGHEGDDILASKT